MAGVTKEKQRNQSQITKSYLAIDKSHLDSLILLCRVAAGANWGNGHKPMQLCAVLHEKGHGIVPTHRGADENCSAHPKRLQEHSQ